MKAQRSPFADFYKLYFELCDPAKRPAEPLPPMTPHAQPGPHIEVRGRTISVAVKAPQGETKP